MYRELFGHPGWSMYNLIGVLGYGLVVLFFLCRSTWPAYNESGKRPVVWVVLPLFVHLIGYTFAGKLVGPLLDRNTEFLGYVTVSSVGIALASGAVGVRPLRWLDDTTPLYLALASALKIGCFCSGCCNGLPWEYGLYNHLTEQREFPIQLVELMLYAALLWMILRCSVAPGRRFALFLVGYSLVRFVVQFFRADRDVFTSFHWISILFFGIGLVCWWVFPWLSNKSAPSENQEM